MTSGVRRLTFFRAVVPLEIRFVLIRWSKKHYIREALFQRPVIRLEIVCFRMPIIEQQRARGDR